MALAFGFGGALRADTPTATPSPTETPSASPTSTPGPGSYSYELLDGFGNPINPPFLVPGNTGYQLKIIYSPGTEFSDGQVVVTLPTDFTQPTPAPANFYVVAAESADATTSFPGGQTIDLAVSNIGPSGEDPTLDMEYGTTAAGFSFSSSTTLTAESVTLSANADLTPVAGDGVVQTPAPIPVYSPTVSPTTTASPTVSPTETSTPDYSPTPLPTNTASPTATPIGTPVASFKNMHSYPNPFDLRLYSFVTIAYPPTTETVSITIFNLAGNPVCEIPPSEIEEASGLAQWYGVDDYGRVVPGGLYFIRLKTPSVTVIHKMTVFH